MRSRTKRYDKEIEKFQLLEKFNKYSEALANTPTNKIEARDEYRAKLSSIDKKINKLEKELKQGPQGSKIRYTKKGGGIPGQKKQTKPASTTKKITNVECRKRWEERRKIHGGCISEAGGSIAKINWEILPEGCSWLTFEPYFNNQIRDLAQDFLQKEIEEAKKRFKCILELRPKQIYKGLLSFSDYFALHFDECEEVVLESVVYGNAVYIVKGDWRLLSQKTKSDLKKSHNPKVIHHKRDWFSKLKNHLQIGFE